MPVKIRLARRGKKGYPFYHIVVADSRAPRDGKFIENIGSYNPNTNPATITLNFDQALAWLQKGAQPTDTCRAILSYKGVMYKKHLLGGVSKGAFSAEVADARFAQWMEQKADKIAAGESAVPAVAGRKVRLRSRRRRVYYRDRRCRAENPDATARRTDRSERLICEARLPRRRNESGGQPFSETGSSGFSGSLCESFLKISRPTHASVAA